MSSRQAGAGFDGRAPSCRERLVRAHRLAAAVAAVSGLLVLLPRAYGQAPDPCFGHADGALCNDGNPCSLNDVCQQGFCRGTLAPNGTDCTDGNLCTTLDRCVFGLCVGQTVPEGDPCEDGNMCTVGERCRRGLCTPESNLSCDDGNVCTNDLCIPNQGCVNEALAMCTPPDGGFGGQGGAGGGGMGGGGMGGSTPEDAGMSDAGDGDAGAGDAAVPEDAEVPFDAPVALDADASFDAPTAEDALDAGIDGAPPFDPITYQVEGGALLCSFEPGRAVRTGAIPLSVGLAWVVARCRRRRARARSR